MRIYLYGMSARGAYIVSCDATVATSSERFLQLSNKVSEFGRIVPLTSVILTDSEFHPYADTLEEAKQELVQIVRDEYERQSQHLDLLFSQAVSLMGIE